MFQISTYLPLLVPYTQLQGVYSPLLVAVYIVQRACLPLLVASVDLVDLVHLELHALLYLQHPKTVSNPTKMDIIGHLELQTLMYPQRPKIALNAHLRVISGLGSKVLHLVSVLVVVNI